MRQVPFTLAALYVLTSGAPGAGVGYTGCAGVVGFAGVVTGASDVDSLVGGFVVGWVVTTGASDVDSFVGGFVVGSVDGPDGAGGASDVVSLFFSVVWTGGCDVIAASVVRPSIAVQSSAEKVKNINFVNYSQTCL